MQEELLKRIYQNIKGAEAAITEARELIDLMREAGEDVREMEETLRELEIRKERWIRALEVRGIKEE